MKDQQDGESHTIQFNDSQSFSYIWKKLKYSIFDVLFVLLDNSQAEGSMFGLIFQSGVDYLQMLSFPFNTVVMDVWNNNTLNGITTFFNNFNVSSYMPGIGFSTFLVLLYALIFLIIIVICDIIYVAYSFSKKKFRFTFPLIFMAKIVPLIVSVMFLPIMETLLNVVNCQSSSDGTYQVLQSFPDVICWEKWHLFHTIITLIFSFLFVFVSSIVALTIFQPRMTTNSLTARQNSTGQVVFIINKIICQFIFSFSPFQGSLPYCVLLFAMSSWLYYTYNVSQPYYNRNATKFFRICSTYYFWTNLMLLASQLLSSVGFEDGLVIWVCGIIFIGITIVFQRKSNIDTLFSSSLKFKSGQQLQSHLQYVLNLHHNRNEDKNSYMLLLGYIQKHIQLCLEQDCPLKYSKMRFASGKQQEQYSCKQLLKQIERMFIYGIKKYPQCTKLRLTFAFFYMQKYENNTKAYQQFAKSLTTQPSFGEQFIIYRFKKIITEKLEENKQTNQQDLIEIIRFDNHISLCQQGMLVSGKLHKQFWNELREQSPNLETLNLIGARVIQTNEMIEQNYKQVVALSNDGLLIIQLQYNYSLYLLFICHQMRVGKRLLQKVKRKFQLRKRKQKKIKISQQENKMNEVLNTKKGLLICQLQFQQNGYQPCCRIRKVNKQLLELTKYQEEQLISKRLDKILPKILEDYHDIKIKQWLEDEEMDKKLQSSHTDLQNKSETQNQNQNQNQQNQPKRYIGQSLVGYLKQSTGFIKKVKYQVHFIPLQVKFVAEMKNFPASSQCLILCDSQGIISQVSKSTLFRFPESSDYLQIQRFLGYGVVQKLNQSSTGTLVMSIHGKDNNQYECYLQKLEIKLNHIEHKQKADKLMMETLVWNNQEIRYIGIVATLTEQKGSLVNKSLVSSFVRNRNSGTIVQSKRGNNLSRVTSVIQNFYFQISNKSRKQQKKSILENSMNKFEKSKVNNFVTYVNVEGIQCNIKVFRYVNGQYTRIYYDGLFDEQSDYDFEQKIADLQARLSSQKMKDPDYQQRIKKSLNTFIYHPEVVSIFSKTITLFLIFIAMQIWIFSDHQTKINEQQVTINKCEENFESLRALIIGLQQILFTNQLSFFNDDKLESTKINMHINPAINTTIQNYKINQKLINVDLTNALILTQANLLRYHLVNYTSTSDNFTLLIEKLGNAYTSYLTKVMDCLRKVYQIKELNQNNYFFANNTQLICFIVTIVASFLYVLIWIYQSLIIRIKIYSILIWFLDIPFQYINFAQKQCLHFTKNYLEIEKTNQNSLNQLSQCQHYIEEYNHKQKQNKDNEEQKQCGNKTDQKSQNFKARQILISRYGNLRLFTVFNIRELKKILLFFFFNSFIVAILVVHMELTAQIRLTKNSFNLYTRQYFQITSVPMILKFMQHKSNNTNYFGQSQLEVMLENSRQNIKDIFLQKQKLSLYLISSSDTFNTAVFEQQTSFEYLDLCQGAKTAQNQCYKLLNGRLRGGYSGFKTYLMQLENKNLTQPEVQVIQKAFRVYISPLMDKMLDNLLTVSIQNIDKIKFIINIVFYIYIICITLFFVFPWNLYLRRLNIKINQTFQILNLIPMVLLPVGRSKTRQFLKWIIFRASQQNCEQQQ